MRAPKLIGVSTLSLVLVLTGCVAPNQPGASQGEGVISTTFTEAFNNPNACSNNSKDIGLVVGVLGGAAAGLLIKRNLAAAAFGAVAGGIAGFAIGALVDHRRCEIYKIAQVNDLQVASGSITATEVGDTADGNSKVGMDVLIQDDSQFEPQSDQLTSNAQNGLPQIAQQYNPQVISSSMPPTATSQDKAAVGDRAVLVINRSSTNDPAIGNEGKSLSTSRAKVVANILATAGVPADHIYYQGAGDTQSVVPTSEGSATQANNSTEIIDFPDSRALQNYVGSTTANPPADAVASNGVPAIVVPPPTTVLSSYKGYDFGGQAVSGNPPTVYLGQSNATPILSLIASAYAATAMNVQSCVADHPRTSSAIVNLGTGDRLDVAQATPGFYGAPWEGGFNGNLVAVLNAYVASDSSATVPDSNLEVYKNYHSGIKRPDYRKEVPVNVYRSQDRILYRMFISKGPMKCMDLVVDNGTPSGDGTIYYDHDGALYSATGQLALQH